LSDSLTKLVPFSHQHLFNQQSSIACQGYLIFTSDRGLCGGYNINLFKYLESKIRADSMVWVVGAKGLQHFKMLDRFQLEYLGALSDKTVVREASGIAKLLTASFQSAQVGELYVGYNKFVNRVTQHPTLTRLLPFEAVQKENQPRYEYEPTVSEVVDQFFNAQLVGYIYEVLLEAKVSELAAKVTAMGNATDNVQELKEELGMQYNRLRQMLITQEIAEIVGGMG
ncbi:MAG: hypothetical protein RLZ12_978, partial [Bacillota bacterium]